MCVRHGVSLNRWPSEEPPSCELEVEPMRSASPAGARHPICSASCKPATSSRRPAHGSPMVPQNACVPEDPDGALGGGWHGLRPTVGLLSHGCRRWPSNDRIWLEVCTVKIWQAKAAASRGREYLRQRLIQCFGRQRHQGESVGPARLGTKPASASFNLLSRAETRLRPTPRGRHWQMVAARGTL